MFDNSLFIVEKIRKRVDELYPEIVGIRREIHRHPELSFQEFRTTALIRDYLLKLGLKVEHDFLDTGVVALLEGGGSDKASSLVALRADIDALPLQEENTHDFCSREQGRMHACGHDMHTAILLGTAAVLSEIREKLPGNVLFIFQPAEEKAPGGAKLLIDAGLFQEYEPSAVFALHCFPDIPAGKVALHEGGVMAAADELYITVYGEGGHASAPHKAADPILAAAHIITAVQHLVSRVTSPYEPVVVSLCSIKGGNATNVIPGKVAISGTLRAMNEGVRAQIQERLRETVEHVAKGLGCRAELEIVKGYPVVVNDPETTRALRKSLVDYFGMKDVVECEPSMTAEDFSNYLQHCPGVFMKLGTGRNVAGKKDIFLHSPFFDPDESSIATGMGAMSYAAFSWLTSINNAQQ